ncbi:MAG: hypothetical protein JWM99_3379 [Verrucomicrobiales bacterium]|nr:hypothetical protein [Verrucomicrobiales bacterium]
MRVKFLRLDFRITTAVPPNATSGPITVLTPHGNVISTVSFQVPPPALSITFNSLFGLEIEWLGTAAGWGVEISEDLGQGAWIPVTMGPLHVDGLCRVRLPASAGNHFFRLRQIATNPLGTY